jgi:hypothetical protein
MDQAWATAEASRATAAEIKLVLDATRRTAG